MKKKYTGKLAHRSLLFTAGHNLKYINKSFQTDADAIVFDLEDAVPENKKTEAREVLREFLSKPLPDNRSVYVRINPLESGYTILDIDAVASPYLDGFVYPMAYSAKDLIAFDAQLSLKEKILGLPRNFFQIIVLIETPESILKLNEISTASERIIGLLFGSEDFLAEQEGSHGENGVGIQVPRHLISMAAKAHNLMAIDTPFVNVGNFEGLKKHISQARILGFDGMLIMSPKELDIANSMYAPNEEEIKKASEIVKLKEQAEKENKGIVIYNGIFISPPTLKAAKKTLEKHKKIEDYLNSFQINK
ncbi:MAG: CoA ester lyase [Bacteroidota bacterium]|nr:CoA ester lyase [Bacteroidota bacterium]